VSGAYAALKAHILKIDAACQAASTARDLPRRRYDSVMAIKMVPGRTYPETDGAQTLIAARMRDRAAAEERTAGEVARDRELKRLAVVLDQLRADLPGLATAARFELCDLAREMRS
jgi:hypothetical protein